MAADSDASIDAEFAKDIEAAIAGARHRWDHKKAGGSSGYHCRIQMARVVVQRAIQPSRFYVKQGLRSGFGPGHLLLLAKSPVDQLLTVDSTCAVPTRSPRRKARADPCAAT